MDSKTLQEMLESAGAMSESLAQSIQVMTSKMNQLIEENNNLKIENAHLRERLDNQLQDDVSMKSAQEREWGMSNLEKLYDAGVHICHNFYGAKRDESCLLCESLLWHEK